MKFTYLIILLFCILFVPSVISYNSKNNNGFGYGYQHRHGHGHGHGGSHGGHGSGGNGYGEMKDIHTLFRNRGQIQRQVEYIENGILTTTTSPDPDVAQTIQSHVHAMKSRVEDHQRIHQHDPTFRQLFDLAEQGVLHMEVENLKDGVRVRETGSSVCATQTLFHHAGIVSRFLSNGMKEAHKEHSIPPACQQ
eukprot:gb/GECH01012884.1/.p1 GENE.gb/GECH01012884.1/~~gb/GECH01012884.1/.p1  ORF type:complete len:193 (+),score=48.60 gb/GECH01012884.1/:1-579(+)